MAMLVITRGYLGFQTEKSGKSGYECGIAKAELTPRVAPY